MTNADNCCCTNTENTNLFAILQQDRSIFVRLSQLAQAFGGQASGSVASSNVSCTSEETILLASILAQRQANFDQLQQVILAV